MRVLGIEEEIPAPTAQKWIGLWRKRRKYRNRD
jgi:hypothetical protein